MSSSIDQRIVEMQFNNQQFESAVSQTLSSLDSLKNSLNVLGSAEALEGLADVDTSGIKSLSDEVDKSSSKFSVLEEIAVGALRRIGEMAIEAGANLARNLGNTLIFDNISAGWQKYADKSESVQTIMAATREELAASGNQMEIVNEELEKLNWFTDETSFNFTDMTSNIGKFTSAGVGLEDSTKAMMGISTWAAASGANINQASHAMYNLSQAMGVGAVTLADWKSIENANMATIEFKKTALETAVAEGTLIKVNEDLYKTLDGTEVTVTNFRETLTEDKWLDSNVLIKTLDKYGSYASKLADGQSELNNLTDDYYETTSKLLKDVDRYIDGTLDLNAISKETGASVADLTEQFDLLSKSEDDLGRRAFRAAQEATTFQQAIDAVKDAASTTWMNIFEDVFGDYEHAKVLWTDLSNALWDTFVGPLANLEEVVGSWSEQGGNAFAIEGVLNLWEAFASVLGAVGEALGELFPPLTAEKLVDLTRAFRDFTADLKPSEETLERIKNVVLGLVSPFKFLFGAVKRVITAGFPPLISLGGKIVSLFIRLAGTVGGAVASAFVKVGEKVGKIFTALNNVKVVMFSQLSDPLKRISAAISRIFDSIVTKVKGLDIFKKLGEKVTGFTDLIVKSISKWGFDNWKLGSFKNFGDLIASIFEKAADAVEKYDLNGKVNNVITFLGNAFDKLKGYLSQAKAYIDSLDISGKIASFIEYITESYHSAITSVQEYIDKHENLKNVVDWFQRIYDTIKNAIEEYGLFNTIGGGIAIAFETVKSKFAKLTTILQNSGILKTVGNAFVSGFESVKTFALYLYDTFSPYVIAATEEVKEFFKGFGDINLKTITDWLKNLKETSSSPIEFLKNMAKSISEFWKSVTSFSIKQETGEKIKKAFTAIGEGIVTIYKAIKEAFGDANAIEIFEKILDIIKVIVAIKAMNSLEKVGNSISGFFNSLSSFFKREKKQTLSKTMIEIATALAILSGSLWIIAQIPANKLGNAGNALAGLMTSLVLVATLLPFAEKVLDSDLVSTGTGLLMLVGSVALMIGVIKLIEVSGISFDTVKENAEAFIVTFGLIGLMLLASKLAGKNAQSGGVGIVLMSVALGLIIGVIKELAKISDSTLDRGKKVVTDLLGVFAGVMALSIFSGKNASKAGSMMIKMAIALGLISVCISIVGDMDSAKLKQGIKAMTELMVVMGIVVALSSFSSKSSKSIMAMAFAIAVIAGALVVLTQFSSGKEMVGAIALSTVLSFLALTFFSLSRSRATFLKALGTSIVLGLILYEVVGALLILSNFNGEHIFANSGALARVLFTLGGALKTLAKIEGSVKKMVGTAVAMGIILYEIAGALIIMSRFGGDDMFANAMTLSLVLNVLLGVFKKFSKITATTKKMRSTAITMGIVIGAIAGSLAILGQFGGDQILVNALALSAVLVVLVKVFENFKPIKASIGDCLKTAVMMGAVLLAVVGSLALLNKYGGDRVLENTLAISAVLVALGLVLGVLNGFKTNLKTAGVVALEMGLILAELVAALVILDKFGGTNVLDNALALSEVVIALSAAIGIFSLLGVSAIGGAIAAVASIFIFLGGLALVLDWFGQWASGKAENIEAGIEIVKRLGYGIGEFAGSIVKGFGDVAFGSLPEYGKNLSDFGESIKGFLQSLSEAPDGIADKAAEVAKAIITITAAELVQGIASWIGSFAAGGVANFGQQLSSFGESFSTFVTSMEGIEVTDAATAAAAMAESMVALAVSIPNSGGVLGWLMGENDIDTFGARLNNFAIYFTNFVNTLSEIKGDYKPAVDACTAATQCMIALSDTIPNSGGVLGWIMGENDIDIFGARLNNFAIYFKNFIATLTSIQGDYQPAIDACKTATSCMIELSKNIPNSGGILGIIMGENDINDFGAKLSVFAVHFTSFVNTLTNGIDGIKYQLAVSACAMATSCMANLAENIPNSGGILGFIVGNNDIDDFGAKLSSFATHFVAFANEIVKIPAGIQTKVTSAKSAASVIAEFANTKIEQTGGLLQFFTGDNYKGLEAFGAGLNSLGVGLGGYYDQLKNIDLAAVEQSFNLFNAIIEVANLAMNTETSSLYNIVDGMRAVGTSVLSGFTSVFAGTDGKGVATGMLNAAFQQFFEVIVPGSMETKKELTKTYITDTLGPDIVAAFDKSMLTDDLEAIGTRVVEDIENGIIAEQDPDAVGVVTDLGQALTDAINEILPEGVWYDVGYNAAQGLAEGIAAGTDAAVNAAVAMAQAVEAAAHVTLKINSPSRVFMGIGNYVVEGFVKGITDKQSYATGSVSSTFAAISSYIANSIDDNLDFSPVITPVLDLTNLEKGSAAMDSMFGQRNLSGYAVAGPENVNIQDDAINRLVMGMDKFINRAQNEPQPPINIYVTGGNNADANEIADVVMDKLNVELHRRRAAMA